MTTTSTLPSTAQRSAFRVSRPSDAVRYLIAGIALLFVSVSSLWGAVSSWSEVTTSGFLGYHYVQVIIAAFGCALVVGGIVKSRKH